MSENMYTAKRIYNTRETNRYTNIKNPKIYINVPVTRTRLNTSGQTPFHFTEK